MLHHTIRLPDRDLQRGLSPSPDPWETSSATSSPINTPVVQPDRDNPQQIKSIQLSRKPAATSTSESQRALRKISKENANLRQEVADLKLKLSDSESKLDRIMNVIQSHPAGPEILDISSGVKPQQRYFVAVKVPKLDVAKTESTKPGRFLEPMSSTRSEARSGKTRGKPAGEGDEQGSTIKRLRKLVESFQNEVIAKANEIAQLRQKNAMLLLMNDPSWNAKPISKKDVRSHANDRHQDDMLKISGENIIPTDISSKTGHSTATSMSLPITTSDVLIADRNGEDQTDSSMQICGSSASAYKSPLLFELDASETRAWNELIGRIERDQSKLKKIETKRQQISNESTRGAIAASNQFLYSLKSQRNRQFRPGSLSVNR